MSIKAAEDRGHVSQSHNTNLLAGLRQWGDAHTSNPGELERAPGSWDKPFPFSLDCYIHCSPAVASEERQAPHTEPSSLLAKAVQLERYKRPEAGISISFLMTCMNAIQAELSWCLLNTCQGRCSASGHPARATAVGRMSGRACCLLLCREKPLEERTREQPHLFMSGYKYSQSWPLGGQDLSHQKQEKDT